METETARENKPVYVSLFPSGNSLKKAKTVTIDELFQRIKEGASKQKVEQIRRLFKEGKEDEKARAKVSLPSPVYQGIFSKPNEKGSLRHNDGLETASGIAVFDFDHLEDPKTFRDQIFSDYPEVIAAFISPSGDGVKVLFRIPMVKDDPEYKEYYIALLQLFNMEKTTDEQTKDISRVCFESYDPGIKIRPYHDAKVFTDRITQKTKEAPPQQSKYNHDALNKAATMIRKSFDGIKHDTLLKASILVGGYIASGEIKESDAIEALEKEILKKDLKDPDQARQTILDGINHGKEKPLETKEEKNITQKLIEYIQQNYNFRRNKITGFISSNGRVYDISMQNTIYLDAKVKFNSKNVTKQDIDAIIISEITPPYDPFVEFYEANKHLPDKPEIIDHFITSITSDTPNAGPWIRKWLIALAESIVKREGMFYPRIMIVFCGGQNTGKTHWFRHLLPTELLNYYAESNLDKGKDDELLMCEKLLISVDEYAGKTVQSDPEKLKRLISQNYFSLRRPYGKFNEDCKRFAVLAGTSNTSDILNDVTGNTRIIPINVLSIDHDIYNRYDKKHLLIELIRAVHKKESSVLSAEDLRSLNEISDSHKAVNYEAELIVKYFEPGMPGNSQFYTTSDVMNLINQHSTTKLTDRNIRKLGRELTALFPQAKATGTKGSTRVRGYNLKLKAEYEIKFANIYN